MPPSCHSTPSPIVLVGLGYVGQRLLDACQASGRLVYVLSRSPGEGAMRHALDLDRPSTLPFEPPPGATIVYTVPPPGQGEGDPRLAGFLDALGGSVQRLVYLSTSGVYGDTGGALVDESARLRPASDRALRRVEAERILAAWARTRRGWVSILRVPGIYGPHRLPIELIASGQPFIEPGEAPPGNRIHVDDLVTCILAAADRPGPGGVFNVADGSEMSSTDFALETARLAGLPAPPLLSREKASRAMSPGRWSFMRESRRLDSRRMREQLGVRPRYADPVRGLRASLLEMGVSVRESDQG
jgi:nucleoside-diphosphate-sugar epimerase